MDSSFSLDATLSKAREFLIPQGPLKEFVAQNPLRGFLALDFRDAVRRAALTWGSWSYLPLGFYRNAFEKGDISDSALRRSLEWNISDASGRERTKADLFEYPEGASKKPLSLVQTGIRTQWTNTDGVNIIEKSSAVLFRLLGAYLDQGISIWPMPNQGKSFLETIRDLADESLLGYQPFNQPSAKALLKLPSQEIISKALANLTGSETLYERYVFDIFMSTPGWSSTVAFVETNPDCLVSKKRISLKDLLAVVLVLDVAFLEKY